MADLYEDPASLLLRLKLGREEFCQRLLTTLIVGGLYPPWNSRSRPTSNGRAFLEALDVLSFGAAKSPEAEVFVDELELTPLVADERGGAPDWAVLWDHRTWLIELKTEAGSHRPAQIPGYFTLCGVHFPGTVVDITYLTGPLAKPAPAVLDGQRYSHVTWQEVLPLVEEVWREGSPAEERYVRALRKVVSSLAQRWTEQRVELTMHAGHLQTEKASAAARITTGDSQPSTSRGQIASSIEDAIGATARDGMQRAVDPSGGSLDDLLAQRQEALRSIRATPSDAPERRVQPWVWRRQSTGTPLTAGGADVGYELRFSRYKNPL